DRHRPFSNRKSPDLPPRTATPAIVRPMSSSARADPNAGSQSENEPPEGLAVGVLPPNCINIVVRPRSHVHTTKRDSAHAGNAATPFELTARLFEFSYHPGIHCSWAPSRVNGSFSRISECPLA